MGFDVDGFYQRDLLIGVSTRCVGSQRLEAARLPLLSEIIGAALALQRVNRGTE